MLTLEQILTGCKKRMKISRRYYDQKNGYEEKFEERIITIDIKPGTAEGNEYRFNELCDENLGSIPGDVVFTVETKPHLNFKRVNQSDLLYTALITKSEIDASNYDKNYFYRNVLEIPTLIVVDPTTKNQQPMEKLFLKNITNFEEDIKYPGLGLPLLMVDHDNKTESDNFENTIANQRGNLIVKFEIVSDDRKGNYYLK